MGEVRSAGETMGLAAITTESEKAAPTEVAGPSPVSAAKATGPGGTDDVVRRAPRGGGGRSKHLYLLLPNL